MKKIFRIILYSLLVIIALPLTFLVVTQAWFYASYPIYSFHEPQPFSGDCFYNPYTNVVRTDWRKSLFHTHTESWMGLTHGDNSREELLEVYHALNYEVISVSNYMTVDTGGMHLPSYIPCYEHGYGYGKTHQMPMGTHGPVLWRDYVFVQNSLSQKQYTLDLLKPRCEVLAINHPDLRYGYTPEDFKYLCNYDLMEVLNGVRYSVKYWDSALSHGHAVWITANDDSHGVNDLKWVQREVLFVNTPTTNREDILFNLSHGAAFAVSFPRMPEATLAEKQTVADKVSFPESISVRHNSLIVKWQQTVSSITFIGDGGQLLASAHQTDCALYPIQPENTYVRVELRDEENGFTYYLNPVVRTSDGHVPAKQQLASVNAGKTMLKRITILLCIVLVAGGGGWWVRRKVKGNKVKGKG
ncbi:MAG: hypothetical protein LBH91_01295 [Prevotellaceae bacterium]|jgi:hypothetical protein|nr:hypothetical protein [Prevotellaceae bacterium]